MGTESTNGVHIFLPQLPLAGESAVTRMSITRRQIMQVAAMHTPSDDLCEARPAPSPAQCNQCNIGKCGVSTTDSSSGPCGVRGIAKHSSTLPRPPFPTQIRLCCAFLTYLTRSRNSAACSLSTPPMINAGTPPPIELRKSFSQSLSVV